MGNEPPSFLFLPLLFSYFLHELLLMPFIWYLLGIMSRVIKWRRRIIGPVQLVIIRTVPQFLQEIITVSVMILNKLVPDLIAIISRFIIGVFRGTVPGRRWTSRIVLGQQGAIIGLPFNPGEFDPHRRFRAHIGPGGDRHGHYQHKTQQKCKHLTFHPNTPLPFNPLIKTLY